MRSMQKQCRKQIWRFSNREQTGTCNRYMWNSSDSSAPEILRLFLNAPVINKGNLLFLHTCCDSVSRGKKMYLDKRGRAEEGFKISTCSRKFLVVVVVCTTWPYLSFTELYKSQKYIFCIAERSIKKDVAADSLARLSSFPDTVSVTYPHIHKQGFNLPPV